MKYPTCIFLLFFHFLLPDGFSQELFSLQKNDSLIVEGKSGILSNNLFLRNITSAKATFNIYINSPESWKIIGSDYYTISVDSFEEEVIPISVFKMPGAFSQWEKINIAITNDITPDTFHTCFHVFTPPIRKFSIYRATANEIELSKNDEPKKLGVKIVNEGNIEGYYKVNWRNDFLKINEIQPVLLSPGKDTTVFYTLAVNKQNFDDFNMQGITCNVADSNRNSRNVPFTLYNVMDSRKMYASAFKTMKMNFSSGFMQFGKMPPSYYFSSNGFVDIDSQTYLNYTYQSKQYNILNQLQRDIYTINVHHKNWALSVGQMQSTRYFTSYGNGAQLSYTTEKSQYKIWANKHYNNNSFQKNDNAGISLLSPIGKMKLQNELVLDHDTKTQNVSGIFNNKWSILDNENLKISFSGGLGYSDQPPPASNKLSTSFGYSAYYNTSFKLSARSTLQKNSKNFPGMQAGLFKQFHELRQQIGKTTSISLFYQYNSITRNSLRDSLYNTDIFSYNTERYGITYFKSHRYSQLRLSAGIMKQTAAAGFVPNYDFVQVFYTYNKKNVNISFSSINAVNPTFKKLDFISNTNLLVGYKYAGLTAIYTRVLNNPVVDASNNKFDYNETINLAPYVRFSMFKNIGVVVNYNVSKLVNNDFIMQFVGGSINYNGLKNGLNFSFNASIPLKNYQNNAYSNYYGLNYFTATLSKSFNVPVSPKKKYHKLTLDLFYDDNFNGRKDKKEQSVEQLPVKIENVRFRSSQEGEVTYKNIHTGKYNIEVDNNALKEGYLPKNGAIQSIKVSKSKEVRIPFVKSKIIKGVITVILDSNRRKTMTAEKLKVILSDIKGNVLQTTVANHLGEYYFNVPAGIYKVSLNEAAFDSDYTPEVMYFTVDVTKKEREEINFLIKQKKRVVNIRSTIIN